MARPDSKDEMSGLGYETHRDRKQTAHTSLLKTAANAVELKGVTKSFGDFTAVDNLDLTIRQGEFFSMLGPSGSGKTTVLRMIAGFEPTTSGSIFLDGQDVTSLPPFDREVNTVFQDYALFPHMTIFENVEYGLKVHRVPKAERQRLVTEALEQVRLDHLAERRPSQLSGGQRQRIALARALILRPKVLLLDEPLGALDKQLREQMQVELKQIQREVGITFVFVTHDQEEALTLSDRIAVFKDGEIEQIGTPREVYEKPTTSFVAKFLGITNLLDDTLSNQLLGRQGTHSLRPERIRIHTQNPAGAATARTAAVTNNTITLPATVREVVYAGPATRYLLDTVDDHRLIAEVQNTQLITDSSKTPQRGDRVTAEFEADHATAIPG
ncbi:ABC transporter ATP-binding protein [Leucobacter sp. OH1287]|uniref:ABC transporter ATP-binding protein n=1 Tax=Leucobacter sp. OH1287 TaxID=2491049 RepID=UPI001F308C6C|nr:ABC transporter ATP-binding protein [Leucobacter sp. OH1287]